MENTFICFVFFNNGLMLFLSFGDRLFQCYYFRMQQRIRTFQHPFDCFSNLGMRKVKPRSKHFCCQTCFLPFCNFQHHFCSQNWYKYKVGYQVEYWWYRLSVDAIYLCGVMLESLQIKPKYLWYLGLVSEKLFDFL